MFDKESTLENASRFQNFFVFDPASIRVSESDIFLIGKPVVDFYQDAMDRISKDIGELKIKILHNRLQKIGHMLDLLNNYDNIIIVKFFDRIWRRYSYITHLGEPFFDLKMFMNYFPEHKENLEPLVATRLDLLNDFDEEQDEDKDKDSNEEVAKS